jgi:hypothetical protein
MKTKIISVVNLLLCTLLLGVSILTSCVKDDTTPPVITIVGPASVDAVLGTIYVDQGATAFDDTDENITDEIVVNNTVNIDLKGVYTVTYSVADRAGNTATATRTVHVRNSVDAMAGIYLVSGTFNGNPDNNYTNDTVIVSTTVNNRIIFSHFAGYPNAVLWANINSNDIYIIHQSIVCGSDNLSRDFESTSGTITDATHFTISGTVALTSDPFVTTPWSYNFTKN